MPALGIFYIQGGTASQWVFQLATPLFPRAEIVLDSSFYPGGKLVITTQGEGFYIQSATFNGFALTRPEAGWNLLKAGGDLSFKLGAEANHDWGSGAR